MVPPLAAALGSVIVSHHLCTELSTLVINKLTLSHVLYLSQVEPRRACSERYIMIIMAEQRPH